MPGPAEPEQRADGPPAAQPTGDVKACPSAYCHEGALLLGVMTPGGTLAYLRPPTRVDADFVAKAKAMGRPESRFRFSAPCVEAGCPQWTGEGCSVVDRVLEEEQPVDVESVQLPRCGIRSTCRWYSQRGAAACGVCPLVVADVGGVETYQSSGKPVASAS